MRQQGDQADWPGVSKTLRHRWDVSTAQARAIQERLRDAVVAHDDLGPVRHVGGVDIGFEEAGTITRAAAVTLVLPSLETVATSIAREPVRFPYVPGLLSFREVPAALAALAGLSTRPDVVLCDGQGIAHPRRFGLACHIGVLTGLPSIGVAKSRLTGKHGDVPAEKGAWVPLLDGDETIGAVLRTRAGVRPVYVSPGHRVGLETAIDLVMRCVTRFRLPETTRQADRLASRRGQ